MGERNWKPEDVAMVERGDGEHRAICREMPFTSLRWYFGNNVTRFVGDGASARPLVVIDPDNDDDMRRLVAIMVTQTWTSLDAEAPSGMARVLREFANPKPPEPTGLGAVVEDTHGRKWVGAYDVMRGSRWFSAGLGWRTYDEIDVARVISEGVPA